MGQTNTCLEKGFIRRAFIVSDVRAPYREVPNHAYFALAKTNMPVTFFRRLPAGALIRYIITTALSFCLFNTYFFSTGITFPIHRNSNWLRLPY